MLLSKSTHSYSTYLDDDKRILKQLVVKRGEFAQDSPLTRIGWQCVGYFDNDDTCMRWRIDKDIAEVFVSSE